MDEVCNTTNKNQPPSNSAKYEYFYTRGVNPSFISKKNWSSPSHTFSETSTFYHIFTILKVNEVCKRFLYKTLYTLPFFKKKALHHRTFQKHPLFTTFLIIFTVDEVCYTSNKYQPPNNLAKYQYFYTRKFISFLHFEKK